MKDAFREWLEGTGMVSEQGESITLSRAAVRRLFESERRLRHALETLDGEQNDAPLELHRNGWNHAMALTEWALHGKVTPREASPYRPCEPTCVHERVYVVKDGMLVHKDDEGVCR